MNKKRNTIIKLKNTHFKYLQGQVILENMSLQIEEGGFYFLTGDSGAGKTSFLKLLYLDIYPTYGIIEVFSRDTQSFTRAQLAFARKHISVVFQDNKLLDHLNAFDNVALPLRIKGEPESKIREKVHNILKWVKLSDHMHSFPNTLSGGQQQRIAIARSVVTAPKIILADEPTGSVDNEEVVRIMGLFKQLNEQGTTIIMATHNTQLVHNPEYPFPRLHIKNGKITKKIQNSE